jgi:hypothetical protein
MYNELTGSVEQMTSYKETYNLPGILEISSLLQNQKVHYRVHNSPLLVAILCHGNQDHNILQYCFKPKVTFTL